MVKPELPHRLSNPDAQGPGVVPGSEAAQDCWLLDLGLTPLEHLSPWIRKRRAPSILPAGCLRWMSLRCPEWAFRC